MQKMAGSAENPGAGPASGPEGDPPHWLKNARYLRGVDANAPSAGLALSGGGIRSATFCLGLVKALAHQKVFHRFDYLSTVSGGGYAGAAIGKLFNPPAAEKPAQEPQQAPLTSAPPLSPPLAAGLNPSRLAGMDASWFVWWLRATSRYLTPRGFTDILRALATYLRSMLGVHFETAVLGLAVGCAMALFNVGIWCGLRKLHEVHPQQVLDLSQPWMSVWWLLAFFPATAALIYMFAYWQVRREGTDPTARRIATSVIAFSLAVLLLVLLVLFGTRIASYNSTLVQNTTLAACYLLAQVGFAPLIAMLHHRRATGADLVERAAQARNTLTSTLSRLLGGIGVFLALGLLDRLAWWFAFGDGLDWRATQTAFGIVAASLMAARLTASATARDASSQRGTAPAGNNSVSAWIGVLGLLVGFLLLALWVGLAYYWVLTILFPPSVGSESPYQDAVVVGGASLLLLLLYVGLTGQGAGFVNQSSLHMFYRARLARSYLGASNPARFTTPEPGEHRYQPLDAVPGDLRADGANRKTVFDVDPGDLVALADYRPHKGGGPVHILNMTVNQTVDPAGGLFNQDRKGEYLSITTDGWSRLGTQGWQHKPALAGDDLATWTAVSGAAAAPGLGAQTSKGLALLCFLAGVRLGFWWDSLAGQRNAWLSKYRLLVREMLASFPGTRGRYWFLSDGGHFDNTGAYALLRERVGLVVLADCGADPAYDFKDIENLVRKARIDLQTDIRFLRPQPNALAHADLLRFGTLHDLADPGGNACLALASIHYPDAAGQPAEPGRAPDGYLVLVKPNIFHGLPVDLLRYKRDNFAFPQETTTDQFFSEAQWESYYCLGTALGESITPHLLDMLGRPLETELFEPDQMRPAALPADTKDSAEVKLAATVAAAAATAALHGMPRRRERRLREGLGLTALLAALLCGGWLWHLYEKDTSDRDLSLRADTLAARTVYETSKEDDCTGVRMAFVNLAHRWCDQPQGKIELVKLGNRYDALWRKCTGAEGDKSAGCESVLERQTHSCFRGTSTLDGAPSPIYWGWPPLQHAAAASAPKPSACGAPAPDPVPASPPTAAGSSPAVVAGPATAVPAPKFCEGRTVYVQVFGSEQVASAGKRVAGWPSALGAKLPPIEDVRATADRTGRRAPPTVAKDVVIYNTEEDRTCAVMLWQRLGTNPAVQPRSSEVRKPAEGLRVTPGVIEVWLAPSKPA